MKRLLKNAFCGVGFCLLLLAFAEAQEVGLVTAHIDGSKYHSATGPIFSNCGTTCSNYDTSSGYYVSGTGFSSQTEVAKHSPWLSKRRRQPASLKR